MSKSLGQQKMEELSYSRKNVYEEASAEKIESIYKYAEGYRAYLDSCKTEREAVTHSIKMLESAGYTEYKLGDKILRQSGRDHFQKQRV